MRRGEVMGIYYHMVLAFAYPSMYQCVPVCMPCHAMHCMLHTPQETGRHCNSARLRMTPLWLRISSLSSPSAISALPPKWKRCQQPLWPAPAHHDSDAQIRTIYMRSLKHRPFSSLHKLTVFYPYLLFSVIIILMAIARLCESNVDRTVLLHCFFFFFHIFFCFCSWLGLMLACIYCIGKSTDDRGRAVFTMNVRKRTAG